MSRFTDVVVLGDGWGLLADPQGKPYLLTPEGNVLQLDYGPPLLPGWMRTLLDNIDTSERLSRVRMGGNLPVPWPNQVQDAARRAHFHWTTDIRLVWITHACGRLEEHRIPEAENEERSRLYAAEECPACDPDGFWDDNPHPGRSGPSHSAAPHRDSPVDARNL